jgi:hypothetical protein
MLAPRIFDLEVQRPILFRRNFTVNYCRCYDGLYGPGAELHDVSTVRFIVEKGELQVLVVLKKVELWLLG